MRSWTWLAVLLVATTARAEPLSFADALALASQRADVRAVRAELDRRRAMDRRIRRAGGNPQLYLQPGWRTRPSGDEGFELQVQLTQQVNLAGVGRARRQAARTERDALSAEVRERALVARLQAARAWIALWAATERAALVDEQRRLVARWRATLTRARELGAATRVDEARVGNLEAELGTARADAALRVQQATAAMASALNRADADLSPAGGLPEPSLPPVAELRTRDASTLPSAALAQVAVERERARLREVRAAAGANLTFGGLVAVDSPGGLVVSGILSATLPAVERGQRQRSAQSAAVARAEAEAEGSIRDAQRLFATCLDELVRARELDAAVRGSALPSATALAQAYARQQERGAATVFERLEAERRWLEAKARAIDVRAARAWAEARVHLLLDALETP